MTKKHFEAAAAIVRDTDVLYRPAVCHAFIRLFCEYNPRFDTQRFSKACGVIS